MAKSKFLPFTSLANKKILPRRMTNSKNSETSKEDTYSGKLYAIVLDIQHRILPLEGLTERMIRVEEAVFSSENNFH